MMRKKRGTKKKGGAIIVDSSGRAIEKPGKKKSDKIYKAFSSAGEHLTNFDDLL